MEIEGPTHILDVGPEHVATILVAGSESPTQIVYGG